MMVQQQEAARQSLAARVRTLLAKFKSAKRKILQEIKRAQAEVTAIGGYVAKLKDDDEAAILLREAESLDAQLAEAESILSDYEIVSIRGGEQHQVLAEIESQLRAALPKLSEAHREIRPLWRRSLWLSRSASDLYKKEQAAATVAAAKRQQEEAQKRAEALAAARQKRLDTRQAEELDWTRRIQLRRERISLLQKRLASPSPSPNPYSEEQMQRMFGVRPSRPSDAWSTGGLGGLGGFFDELFGTAKKKEKRKQKQMLIQRELGKQDAAAREKRERAARRQVRRKAQIRGAYRAVSAEASQAEGWIRRIQRELTDNPGLPPRLVDEAVASLKTWDTTVATVTAGVGELDIGAEDPRQQDAILSELQAAVAAVRTVRSQSARMKQKVDAAVDAASAKATRLAMLLKQQQAIEAREKIARRRLAESQASEARFSAQRQSIAALQTQATLSTRVQAEQAALNRARQQLAAEERRAAMMAAFREGRSIIPLMRPSAFSGGAW
jgi:hypothetical protein